MKDFSGKCDLVLIEWDCFMLSHIRFSVWTLVYNHDYCWSMHAFILALINVSTSCKHDLRIHYHTHGLPLDIVLMTSTFMRGFFSTTIQIHVPIFAIILKRAKTFDTINLVTLSTNKLASRQNTLTKYDGFNINNKHAHFRIHSFLFYVMESQIFVYTQKRQ